LQGIVKDKKVERIERNEYRGGKKGLHYQARKTLRREDEGKKKEKESTGYLGERKGITRKVKD